MLDERGYEIPDNTPVEIPSRLRLPVSRTEQIRNMIRQEFSRQAVQQGQETFDEADDFDLPDGEEWLSPYEETFEPPIPESLSSGGGLEEGGGTPPGAAAQPLEGAQPPAKPVTGGDGASSSP